MKRFVPVLVALALVICWLPVEVLADNVTMYSYNGYVLGAIPSGYSYAVIYLGVDGSYMLIASNSIFYRDSPYIKYSGDVDFYRYSEDTSTWSYTGSFTADYVGLKTGNITLIWSSHDIVVIDDTSYVYFAGSKPTEIIIVSVVGVNISGPDTVELGSTAQYQANVYGSGEYDTSVIWSLDSQTTASGTGIDSTGALTVAENETVSYITIRATSVQDSTISGALTVSVTVASEDSTDPTDATDPTEATIPTDPTTDSSSEDDDGFCWYGDLYLRDIDTVANVNAPYHFICADDADLLLIATSEQFVLLSFDTLLLLKGYLEFYAYDYDFEQWLLVDSAFVDDYAFPMFSDSTFLFVWADYNLFAVDPNFEIMEGIDGIRDSLDGVGDQVDNIANGSSGVDVSSSDFSSVSDSLGVSMGDTNSVIAGSAEVVSGLVNSGAMVSTLATLGNCFTALFDGNEVSVSGVSSNPFELLVLVFGGMALISLVIAYVFRKRGDD